MAVRLVTAAALAASSLGISAPTAAVAHLSLARPTRELVYVASGDSGPVTAYPAGSTGRVRPVRRLRNPNDPDTFWAPWGIAFDAAGNAYVQTFLSDATSFVFSPRSSTPRRIFRVTGPDLESIAVDARGYEYVMGGEGPPVISIAAPGASGHPGNGYTVSPVRRIRPNQLRPVPWPSVLTVDNHNHVLAVVFRTPGNAIAVYDGGPDGMDFPVRTIEGPSTRLGGCPGVGSCDHVSITYSARTGKIYAAVSGPTGTRVLVFAGGASGDATPIRTISGGRTGLKGKVVTGIAVSGRTGDVYVLAKTTEFEGRGVVDVFGRSASGNIAPLRSFTDRTSRFANAQGIAIGS